MKLHTTLIWCSILTSISAISLKERTQNPRVLSLPIQRSNYHNPSNQRRRNHEYFSSSPENTKSLVRRQDDTVTTTLDNEITTYYAQVSVGNPAQQIEMHIDTGSSDMWVNIANSSLCQSVTCQGGTYDPTASSSYSFVSNRFNISYVDGSAALGDYVKDDLAISGESIPQFQFGIGFTSSTPTGVLGIGYMLNEVQVNRAGENPYPNLPQALVETGAINANAYSLWLNDLSASTGTILFGGVDTAKYTGELATIPIIPIAGRYFEFIIALTGLSIAGQELTSSSSLPSAVLLDSGSTLTYLPDDLASDIFTKLQAVYDSTTGTAYVDCGIANQNSNLDFTFSGQTITVPYKELVLAQATSSTGQPLTFQNGNPACAFGVAPSLGSIAVLGDSFLRSAYVVYDLEQNEISIAQTQFNGGADDVREITRGNNVPGATAVASPVTTLAAGTDGARIGGATITVSSVPTNLNVGSVRTVSGGLVAGLLGFAMGFTML